MSTETQNAPAVEQQTAPAQQQQAAPVSNEDATRLAISSAILAPFSKGAQERMGEYRQAAQQNQPTTTQNQPAAQNQQQQNVAPQEQQSTSSPAATEPTDGDEYEQIPTEFGHIRGPKKQSKAPAAPVQPATLEDAFKQLSSTWGFDVKSPEDLVSKADTFKNWRTAAQKLPEVETKYTNTLKNLETLPDDLKVGVSAALQGHDWREAVEQAAPLRIDLSKDFDKQDPLKMIKAFNGDAFTDEEIKGLDPESKEYKLAIGAAQKQFNLLRTQREAAKAKSVEDARIFKEKYDASVSTSMSRLTEVLPGFTDEAKKSELNEFLSDLPVNALRGTNLGKLLLAEDGTVSADAAAKLAFMKHGSNIVDTLSKRMQELGKSEARQEVVNRGQRQPSQAPGHNTQPVGQQLSAEDKAKANLVNWLKGAAKNRY